MRPPAEVVRQLLLNLGFGSDTGDWPIFVGSLPDLPDNALAVYDTAGKMDGRIMHTGEQIEHEGIQIWLRGASYLEIANLTREVARALDAQKRVSVTLSDETYLVHGVSRSGAPLPLGLETTDRRRFQFTINATLTMNQEE